jgi:hypothetical protein
MTNDLSLWRDLHPSSLELLPSLLNKRVHVLDLRTVVVRRRGYRNGKGRRTGGESRSDNGGRVEVMIRKRFYGQCNSKREAGPT